LNLQFTIYIGDLNCQVISPLRCDDAQRDWQATDEDRSQGLPMAQREQEAAWRALAKVIVTLRGYSNVSSSKTPV
jgi:hypothetical protein